MIELYKLNNPTIPCPHDCAIKKIMVEKEWLIFEFIDDIFNYDSIKNIRPNSKTLIIRYHLIDDFDAYFYILKGLF